ncbi:MAG: hypothetical protein U9Q81_20965 [Pseudomonadota bacterium]|nr:hypothetical protein [Pseudomonadota bacterium]
MRRPNAAGFLILALLAAALDVQAFNFNFPFPGSSSRSGPPPGPGPWQYRPQEPSNARGVPPSYQPPQGPMRAYQRGWPGQYGSPYGQQEARQSVRPPRLELELSDHQPYMQENVLLRLRVVSDENLDTATPELPNTNDVLLQKLEGPKARSRTASGGRREIVNEFVYTLTPLRAGNLEVPPLRVTGAAAENGGYGYGRSSGRRFDVTSDEPLHLQVRPAMASVRPWLALQDLSLKANLDGEAEVEEGQPVTLALELTALGATGSQLPSLEPWLRSTDFRVYREQTLTEGKLSTDGRRLEGKRTEYYTLVPRSGGKLHLPEIRLAWWNVTTGTQEHAGLPIHTLQVDGESGPFGLSTSADAVGGGGVSWFWLPLMGLILLLLGYWGGVWYQGRMQKHPEKGTLAERLSAGLRTTKAAAVAGVGSAAKRLNPAPLLGRVKPLATKTLPASSRFLMCVRAANREDTPSAWAERFQDMTCQHLQFDTQTPLPGVAGRILSLRPAADREQIERLMGQLDAALYGKQDIDFPRWKKQFNRQIGRGRGLVKPGGKRRYLRRPLLPELNPRPAQ